MSIRSQGCHARPANQGQELRVLTNQNTVTANTELFKSINILDAYIMDCLCTFTDAQCPTKISIFDLLKLLEIKLTQILN